MSVVLPQCRQCALQGQGPSLGPRYPRGLDTEGCLWAGWSNASSKLLVALRLAPRSGIEDPPKLAPRGSSRPFHTRPSVR